MSVAMAPTGNAPHSEVALQNRMTDLELKKRASALILKIAPVAREVCMAGRINQIMGLGSVMKITQAPNDYCAPDAVDTMHQEVGRFLQFKRTTRPMGEYSARLAGKRS